MTAAASVAPAKGKTADERLRSRALDTLRTEILRAILSSEEPLRTVDVGRIVADNLGLDLNEEELGGLSALARMLMDSDPLFSQANRQWDLALRMGRAEGDRRKPVERALEDFIDLIGGPSEAGPVGELAAAVYGRTPDFYEKMLERLTDTRPQFFRADRRRIAVTRWLIDLSSDDPEDVEFDNFDDTAAVETLRKLAKGLKEKDPAEYARALVRKAGGPVDGKALQFVTWCAFPDTEPEVLFRALFQTGELALERGPAWTTQDDHDHVLAQVRELARDPQSVSELVAAAVPAEEEEIGILAPTTVRVSDEDLAQVFDYMKDGERTHRLPDLLQEVLEAFPGSRTYQGVRESLYSRMREDGRFRWAGFERFRLPHTIPSDVEQLPPGLAFDEQDYLGEEGAEVDKILDPQEWKHHLDDQVLHYLVQDVGDDSTAPGPPPSRLEASAPLHHYVAGTYYLRNSDRGFFPVSPDLVQVTLLPPDGSRFDVWINNRLGLVFGLKEWYDANLPWVGGRFAIEGTDQPDEFRLVYDGEVEPLMEIPLDRLQQLIALRGEAAAQGLPLTEIIQRIVKAHPDGIDFVTVVTEVNVVRRVRRAQIASVLSAQRYFVQAPQQSGLWSYDEKRATKTRGKKGPKRPMREVYDEDDEEFEVE
jgi:hypothetical protein